MEYYYNTNNSINEEIEVALNPGHNHFILVDDGSVGRFGVEILFRTLLEASIKGVDDKPVPMVLIVVEGGPGTIETVNNALIQKTPVILVKVKTI